MTPEEKKEKRRAYYQANKEKIKLKVAQYQAANAEKCKQKCRDYYAKHKDRIKEMNTKYYFDNLESRKEVNDKRHKEYRARNPDKVKQSKQAWRESNRDLQNALCKQWRDAHPEKCAAYVRNRQAAKLQRTPPWLTINDLQRIEDFYLEAIRRTQETGTRWHVDHIIPLRGKKVSGLHVPENLQVIPAKDNQRKTNSYEV
jgi:hypothetical protein